MAALVCGNLGHIFTRARRSWCPHGGRCEWRGFTGSPSHCAGINGHGDYLFYGQRQRRAFESCGHVRVCSAAQFSVAPRARLFIGTSDRGIAAVFFLVELFGPVGELGATQPQHGVSHGVALAIEIVLTAGLVNVILGTATGARNVGANGAIAIGAYIALAGLWAGPISGASMNPVRSLAPDLLRGDFSTSGVYLVGPLVGALIGVAFEWILKGPPTVEGSKAAQGSAGDEG